MRNKTYLQPTSELEQVDDLGSLARGALLSSSTITYVLVIKPRCNANRPISTAAEECWSGERDGVQGERRNGATARLCPRTQKRQWSSIVHVMDQDISEAVKSYLLMVRCQAKVGLYLHA